MVRPSDLRYFKEPRFLSFPHHRAGYSDRTAWVMSVLADLAYSPPGKAVNAQLKRVGFKFRHEFHAKFMDKYDTYGMLVESKDYAVLVFRGTVPTDVANWITDLNFARHPMTDGMEVHDGFYQAFEPVRKKIQKHLAKLRKPFYISGHSLGGALAVLATFAYAPEFPEQIEACYTYGCPKVGNLLFLETLYKVPIYQVIHRYDLVPHVPPHVLSGFRDSGDIRHLLDRGTGKAEDHEKAADVKGIKGWATDDGWLLKVVGIWLLGMLSAFLGRIPGVRKLVQWMTPAVVIEDHSIQRYSECLLAIAREHNAGITKRGQSAAA